MTQELELDMTITELELRSPAVPTAARGLRMRLAAGGRRVSSGLDVARTAAKRLLELVPAEPVVPAEAAE